MTLPSAKTILNWYLYGSSNVPVEKATDTLIRPDDRTSTVSINKQEFMDTGGGRFAVASQFELVQRFFAAPVDLFVRDKVYTKTEVASLLGYTSNDFYGWDMQQYNFVDGKDDLAERTYIYNSMRFKIVDNTTFVLPSGSLDDRKITNFASEPIYKDGAGNVTENFDLKSNDLATLIANGVFLKPWNDPSGIGRTVYLNFTGNVTPRTTDYTRTTYTNEKDTALAWNSSYLNNGLYDKVKALSDNLFSEQVGTTRFLDSQNRPIFYGTDSDNSLSTHDLQRAPYLKPYIQNGVVLIGGKGNDTLTGYGKNDLLIGGAGADKFHVQGKETIQDATPEDRVYINGVEVTGGLKPLGFDVPIAVNEARGHVFEVLSGDINQPTGATLAVKYLWDNDAIAIIKDYTRPYLGIGDGNIEIYEYKHGTPTSLSDLIKAYNTAYNNTTNTTTTAGGSSAAAPSGADTNSANASATVYKPTIGTTELHATIDAVFDGLSGSGALAKWQQFLPTLVKLKDYTLHSIPQTEDFFGNATTTPIPQVGMSAANDNFSLMVLLKAA